MRKTLGCMFEIAGIITLLIVFYGLLFGFTMGGVHYKIACSQERGIGVEQTEVPQRLHPIVPQKSR